MKFLILFNLVLLLGIFAFCHEAPVEAIQNKTDWVPATVDGIVLGRSTYDDIIKLWGKPHHEAEFAGDPVERENGFPMPELMTELQYRNRDLDGKRANVGVLMGYETRLVKSISYYLDEFTKGEAIRKFGSDYYPITTQASTCIERSQARKQNRQLNWMDYPIMLVYQQKGMLVQVRENNNVMMVNYVDRCK